MAQRMYNRYIETNEDNYSKIISQMVRNIQNYRTQKLREIFLVWRLQSLADKEINQEREKLQAYINSLMQENEILDQERSYLEEVYIYIYIYMYNRDLKPKKQNRAMGN